MGSSASVQSRSYMDILFDADADPPFPDIPRCMSNELLSKLLHVKFTVGLDIHENCLTRFVEMFKLSCLELGVCYAHNVRSESLTVEYRIEGVLRNVVVVFREARNDERVKTILGITLSYPRYRSLPYVPFALAPGPHLRDRIMNQQKHYLLHRRFLNPSNSLLKHLHPSKKELLSRSQTDSVSISSPPNRWLPTPSI